MKLARQYHLERSPLGSKRVNFIARRGSWHGCTLGTLSLGDFKPRKALFEPLLHDNVSHVSPCHPYRDLRTGESNEQYIARLLQELEDEFQRLGPDTVVAFVVEPMVGTVSFTFNDSVSQMLNVNQALGCVTALPGYLRAVKEVCQRHGALLIFDEVMCGLGRTGTLHSWEQEVSTPTKLPPNCLVFSCYSTR